MKEIRQDFAQDGQRWTISTERKLIHLWKKYQRTDVHLKKEIKENQSLQKQRKKEFDELEKYIQSIQQLSHSKEAHIQQLNHDNENLTKQMKQLSMEREAYLRQHQAIADLLVTEGMTEFDRANPQKQIEQLVKDRNNSLIKIQEHQKMVEKVQKEKEEMEEQYGEFQVLKAQEQHDMKIKLEEKIVANQELEIHLQELKNQLTVKEQTLESTIKMYDDAKMKISNLQQELETEKQNCEEAVEANDAGVIG